MEVNESAPVTETVPQQHEITPRPNTLREKTKRPQLSCNPCRSRKVKVCTQRGSRELTSDPNSNTLQCDRIQPCTACSLHQIAGLCQYDLTETERHPILQAEALKEKDKVIANLRRELQLLQGQPQVKMEPRDDEISMNSPHRRPVTSITSARSANVRQRRYRGGMPSDSIYFGAPATTSVVEEVGLLSILSRHDLLMTLVCQLIGEWPTCKSNTPRSSQDGYGYVSHPAN